MPRKWWIRLGVALGALAALGLVVAGYIVSQEGWDGLWRRKREFIEGRNPEFGPALDRLEEATGNKAGPPKR